MRPSSTAVEFVTVRATARLPVVAAPATVFARNPIAREKALNVPTLLTLSIDPPPHRRHECDRRAGAEGDSQRKTLSGTRGAGREHRCGRDARVRRLREVLPRLGAIL